MQCCCMIPNRMCSNVLRSASRSCLKSLVKAKTNEAKSDVRTEALKAEGLFLFGFCTVKIAPGK